MIYWCPCVYISSYRNKLWRHVHVTISVQVSEGWRCPFGLIKGCDDFNLHYRRFHGRQLKVCLGRHKSEKKCGGLGLWCNYILGGAIARPQSGGASFWRCEISKLNFADAKCTPRSKRDTLLTALFAVQRGDHVPRRVLSSWNWNSKILNIWEIFCRIRFVMYVND